MDYLLLSSIFFLVIELSLLIWIIHTWLYPYPPAQKKGSPRKDFPSAEAQKQRKRSVGRVTSSRTSIISTLKNLCRLRPWKKRL